ncbi:glycosyltransferase family 4 protein [Polaribacter sp. KT 15]|uniref:MraY family glycosyltransferase n=1 Tax=Polaribacter sp. KT 15 TaxID=1896175 RepID=UPI000909E9EC|nr:glycosyltransferase family 4 protein [Polaribacter sp. KT 15]SHN01042.1 UDP-N-acetylmuramyl pentapeptide phosphotransferase/UDP-N-acetylglucosamine-1-phosphate transferase [Polaribacter sp. KT 15]
MKIYVLVTLLLAVLSYVYLKLAIKFKIIDKPNQRSSHTKITVRGGGIIFPLAILLFFILNDYQYPYFILGVFLISVISFLDDIYTLSSKIRFPFQFLGVFLILYQVDYPFSPFYLYAVFLILGIGAVNMFNFMDGINGITGLYSLAVISGLFLINNTENIVDNDLLIYPAISLIIFGFYNFRRKALFFAGDIGSIAIGLFMYFVGFLLAIKLSSPLMLLLIIVYGADAGNTLLYRKIFTKESVFDPHRHHVYQKLVDVYKISHLKVASIYAILQLVVNFIIFKTYRLELSSQFIVFFTLIFIFTLSYILLFRKIKRDLVFKNE